MTLPTSGNPISFSQVDVELGYSATAQISMNDSAVRTLFGQASGSVDMNTGHGKANYTTAYYSATLSSNMVPCQNPYCYSGAQGGLSWSDPNSTDLLISGIAISCLSGTTRSGSAIWVVNKASGALKSAYYYVAASCPALNSPTKAPWGDSCNYYVPFHWYDYQGGAGGQFHGLTKLGKTGTHYGTKYYKPSFSCQTITGNGAGGVVIGGTSLGGYQYVTSSFQTRSNSPTSYVHCCCSGSCVPQYTYYSYPTIMKIDSSFNIVSAKYNAYGWQYGYGTCTCAVYPQNVVTDGTSLYTSGFTGSYVPPNKAGVISKINPSDLSTTWAVRHRLTDSFAQQYGPVYVKSVVDSSGNVYALGHYYYGIFVTKVNSSGTLQWCRQFYVSTTQVTGVTWDLAIDSSGNIYAFVYYMFNFGYSPTGMESFVAKWNSSGTIQWHRILELYYPFSYYSYSFYGMSSNFGASVYGDTLILTFNLITNSKLNPVPAIIRLPLDGSKNDSFIIPLKYGGNLFMRYKASPNVYQSSVVWTESSATIADSTVYYPSMTSISLTPFNFTNIGNFSSDSTANSTYTSI
jgi:hypothetical protein